jgi:uncharacterized protein YyaL (SSP411 family)
MRRNCPLLISIGFAACHGCHEQHRAVFQQPATAHQLNAKVVCIKIDREEYPAVDAFYQVACPAARGC